MKKRQRKTAAELMAELNKDPAYLERVERRDRAIDEAAAIEREEERPLIAALRDAGVRVDSVWDLVNAEEEYPAAIPVLFEHLVRDYSDRTKEGIARALAVPGAADGWNTLIDEFERSEDSTRHGSKWALACALEATGNDSVIADVVRIVMDKRHGQNRAPLISILARSKEGVARRVLEELSRDEDLAEDVRRAIRR